jgi:hypothetical protein
MKNQEALFEPIFLLKKRDLFRVTGDEEPRSLVRMGEVVHCIFLYLYTMGTK